ncbi:MAG TPA: hypothetical protein VER11_13115 [Polyangiaceae bacterium]|nr:hypothetical protein [Polyangiaceae bacterium]
MIDQDLQVKTLQWLTFVACVSALNAGCDDDSEDTRACGGAVAEDSEEGAVQSAVVMNS